MHALPDATQAAPGSYLSVVTLGAYKAIKVDASFGAIHAGDMLTTSPNPGYAMKADDAQVKLGSVIGKALSDLDTGTGTIPVMVTLKWPEQVGLTGGLLSLEPTRFFSQCKMINWF